MRLHPGGSCQSSESILMKTRERTVVRELLNGSTSRNGEPMAGLDGNRALGSGENSTVPETAYTRQEEEVVEEEEEEEARKL